MNVAKTDALVIAQESWGEDMPSWIADLAKECNITSQGQVARKMGRSGSMISQVLRKKYRGDMKGVEEVFRGVFQAAVVDCPALGNLPTNECRDWRDKARSYIGSNHLTVMMYKACKGCPLNVKGDD